MHNKGDKLVETFDSLHKKLTRLSSIRVFQILMKVEVRNGEDFDYTHKEYKGHI